MKTFEERFETVIEKVQKGKQQRRNRRILLTTLCLCLILTVTAVLFAPFDTSPPDVSMYSNSPYYSLIQRLNLATYNPPKYRNNFELLIESMENITGSMNGASPDSMPGTDIDAEGNKGIYQEVTDNQVEGVIEADLVKRSDKYIYHLNGNLLNVYSINGEESELLSSKTLYTNVLEDTDTAYFYCAKEMYLSRDCSTVTVILDCWRESKSLGNLSYVCLKNYQVHNGSVLTEAGSFYLTGSYLSSRLVGGKLLLISQFAVEHNLDFGNEETFLPQMGQLDHMISISPENITAPEALSETRYTVISQLNGETLESEGIAAFLSYSSELYVSRDHIFATRNYTESTPNDDGFSQQKSMSEVSCLHYSGERLENLGSFCVEGSILNQYSMDEKDGILRLVTSTSFSEVKVYSNGSVSSADRLVFSRNANLYCVSIGDWEIIGQVEAFAPPGESVRSVRFDGDAAYVCTSLELSDPVFFFDLSDMQNITWKDTGTIEGYSSALVNFGDEYLLGIGFDGNWQLKIEVYEEAENGVISVCQHIIPNVGFSEEYKAYLIDRDNQYLGLGIQENRTGEERYILLKFDGYSFTELVNEPVLMNIDMVRGFCLDGYLYILGHDLNVVKVCG